MYAVGVNLMRRWDHAIVSDVAIGCALGLSATFGEIGNIGVLSEKLSRKQDLFLRAHAGLFYEYAHHISTRVGYFGVCVFLTLCIILVHTKPRLVILDDVGD